MIPCGRLMNRSEETDEFRHESIVFFVHMLVTNGKSCENGCNGLNVEELASSFTRRGFTKLMYRIADGDSQEIRIRIFLMQHPSLFTVENDVVHLTRMSSDLNDELLLTREKRALDYFALRLKIYGCVEVPVAQLFEHINQASFDIRNYFSNSLKKFSQFLTDHEDIFIVNDEWTILRQVYEEAKSKQRPIRKCDDYLTDDRILPNTEMVVNTAAAHRIVRYLERNVKVVAVDCEGVCLGAKNGYITLFQLSCVNTEESTDQSGNSKIKIFLFDVKLNRHLIRTLIPILTSKNVLKVIHDCRADCASLYRNHGIILDNVLDTKLAFEYDNDSNSMTPSLNNTFEKYVGDEPSRLKNEISKQFISDPKLWARRPLNENMQYYAAYDVYSLIRVYFALEKYFDSGTMSQILSKSKVILRDSLSNVEREKEVIVMANSSNHNNTSDTSHVSRPYNYNRTNNVSNNYSRNYRGRNFRGNFSQYNWHTTNTTPSESPSSSSRPYLNRNSNNWDASQPNYERRTNRRGYNKNFEQPYEYGHRSRSFARGRANNYSDHRYPAAPVNREINGTRENCEEERKFHRSQKQANESNFNNVKY